MNPKTTRYELQEKICRLCGWLDSRYEKRIKYLWSLTDNELHHFWNSLQMEER